MEDIIAQISAALVPLLGAVCGYLAGKLRAAAKRAKAQDAADQKQQAALVDGVKSLLRGQIIGDGPTYLEEGAHRDDRSANIPGANTPVSIMPLYLAVYMWKRTG